MALCLMSFTGAISEYLHGPQFSRESARAMCGWVVNLLRLICKFRLFDVVNLKNFSNPPHKPCLIVAAAKVLEQLAGRYPVLLHTEIYGVPCMLHVPMAEEDEDLHSACRCCKLDDVRSCIKIQGFRDLTGFDETRLMEAVFRQGPLAVGVYVDNQFDQHSGGSILRTGLLTEDQLDTTVFNGHYLLLMGYGGFGPNRFWIYRNTYTDWGQRGYGLVSRDLTHCFDDIVVSFGAYIVEGHA